jgi:hypothetical protein
LILLKQIAAGLLIGFLITYGLHHSLRLYNHYTFKMENAVLKMNDPCTRCEYKGTLKHGRADGWYEFLIADGGSLEFHENGGAVNTISTDKLVWHFGEVQKIVHSKN